RARTFRTARHRRSRSAFQVPILSCGNRRVRTEAWQGERRAPTFPARARAGPERRGAPLFGEALARVRLERRLVLGRIAIRAATVDARAGFCSAEHDGFY